MTEDTLELIRAYFHKYPQCAPEGPTVSPEEIQELERFWPFLSADYRQFLETFGGGSVGEGIFGLRTSRNWPVGPRNVIENTIEWRDEHWPKTDELLIISDDGLGNPVGMDRAGRVWISDHDAEQSVCVAQNLEEFLRAVVFEVIPLPKEYYAEEPWPENWRDNPPPHRRMGQ